MVKRDKNSTFPIRMLCQLNETNICQGAWQSAYTNAHIELKEVKVAQLCPTLCDPRDCPLSMEFSRQARILECVAIAFSR